VALEGRTEVIVLILVEDSREFAVKKK